MQRQGELLIRKVKKIEKGNGWSRRIFKKKKRAILAEGEVTGDLHELDKATLYVAEDRWSEAKMYFTVKERAVLTHPEHKPLEFDRGLYEVIKQREYEEQGWRAVRD